VAGRSRRLLSVARAFWLGRSDPDHNSARVPGTTDQILINPMGLMFDEITASNLLKVDLDGNLVSRPNTSRSMPASSFTARSILRGPMSNAWSHPYRGGYRGRRARRRAFAAEPVGDALLQPARLP